MSNDSTVGECMSPNVVSVRAGDSLRSITVIVQIRKLRHLPVIDDDGQLIGIVTDRDIKRALPSPLSPSAAEEYDEIVDNTTIDRVMTREPFTVSSGSSLFETALRMSQRKIGGMPVVDNGQLVGIITATDILRTFIDMMGILTSTSRIDVVVGDKPGGLKKALQIINDKGADIINVGMTATQTGQRAYYFRLAACKTANIKKALEKQGFEVLAALD